MKQLNFRHFNTNRKKITVTVNFGQKETKTAPKRPILFCLVYQEVLSHFPTIPDHLRRFPKTTEDSRRLPNISEEKSENFRLYFVVIFTCERRIFTIYNAQQKCHSFLVKSSWICAMPDRPDVPSLQIKAKMSADGTARSADRGQMGYHRPHRSLSPCRIHPLAQVDQSATATTATTLSSTNVIPVTP